MRGSATEIDRNARALGRGVGRLPEAASRALAGTGRAFGDRGRGRRARHVAGKGRHAIVDY
jgi:hypothetical protein